MLILPEGVELNAFYCDHPGSRNWRSAIVIPARNEQTRIARCLRAIAAQQPEPLARTLTVVVANNCSDDTVGKVLATAREVQLPMCLLDLSLDASLGVGTARKVGTQAAIDFAPSVAAILTTDADCVVAQDWLSKNLDHLEQADVVCGRVMPEQSEVNALAEPVQATLALEADYREACRQFARLTLTDEAHRLLEYFSPANGASLAFRYHALLAAGGFCDALTNEDREIVQRARRAGAKIVFADDVVVCVSCRLNGRAPGGMAATLAAWGQRGNGLDIDLPSLGQLLLGALGQSLEQAGPQRLRLAELAGETQRLQALNDLLGQLPRDCRRAYLQFYASQTGTEPPPLAVGNYADGALAPGGFDWIA